MKRCIPSLKIPKQYRCDICIDGKIHKFGHKACEASVRKIYLPGVCIHSDHSGPYAKSISSARYSQLFLDRGSGYLWAFRQKKKTDHYATLPKVFLDSWALTSRKVQIFQSDGDGVFTSPITRQVLDSEKVRHEWSAPYDSDTNSFVERARRTIFEGVCTALIRSGAPARFWGEAENHKIYTINILPTLPDPEKENSFCSRRMLLEGNRRPPDLEKLMAFGTASTCYIPKERRWGEKNRLNAGVLKLLFWVTQMGCPRTEYGTLRPNKSVPFLIISLSLMRGITHSVTRQIGLKDLFRTLKIFLLPSLVFSHSNSGKNMRLTAKRPKKFC